MENDLLKNNSNLVYSVSVIVCIIIVGFFFIKFNTPKPTQVLTPEGYPAGTTVSLYDTVPPQLPRDLMVENFPLEYSGVVASPDGREQVTVSYKSDSSIPEAIQLYQDTLNKNKWKAQGKADSYVYGTIIAVKDGKSALISFSIAGDLKTLVTYQYEK